MNECGVGSASPDQTFTIAPTCTAPGTPGAPSASVFGSTATISWSAVSGATSYRLDVGTASGAANVVSQVVQGTSYPRSGLNAGTYFMRVRALNGCGAGPASGRSDVQHRSSARESHVRRHGRAGLCGVRYSDGPLH
jgi:hypothetical protein